MAYIDGVSLEVEYTSPPVGNVFSYANVDTSPDYPTQNQIVVRWEVVTVETPGGDPIQTAELTASERNQIFNLDSQYLTFIEQANTVTVDGVSLSAATVVVDNAAGGQDSYVYPNFTLINAVNPVKVRRDTDLSTAQVTFQAGSRLTAGQLNAISLQLLYAAQEQTLFGVSTDASDVDLAGESINNLGDVNINLTNGGAILTIGEDGVITDSTTGGVNEVLSVNGETGNVVLNYADVGADIAGTIPTMDLTELDNVDTTNITPLVAGDVITYDGADYAARRPVEIGTGTGAPPTAWITATHRQVGDLYIRYEV